MAGRQIRKPSLLLVCVLLCAAFLPFPLQGQRQSVAAGLGVDGERKALGERRLRELERKEEDSECWKSAVARLNATCKLLSDVEQSKLAVEFANCHLEKSGRTTYPCTDDMSVKECTLDMDSVAFQTYTEFFTHTTHICYFLQSELWQERTENTVARLSHTSDQVASKLEESLEYHKLMDEKQTEALSNQQEILDQDKQIANALHDTKEKMDRSFSDMNEMAQKQKMLLTEMFGSLQESIDTIRYLMSLLLVEFVGYETFAVLIISWLVVMFLPQFAYSRFKLHLTIFGELCLEIIVRRLFGYLYFAGDGKPPPESLATMHEWLWRCRYAGLLAGLAVYLWEWLSHCDHASRNGRMLAEIQKQNQRIIAELRDQGAKRASAGVVEGSSHLPPSSEHPLPPPPRHSWPPLHTHQPPAPPVEETDFDGGDGVRVGMLGRVVMVGEEDTDGGVIGSLRRRTTPNRQSLLYFEPIPGLQPPVGHPASPYTNQRIRDYIDSLQQLPRRHPPPPSSSPSPPPPSEPPGEETLILEESRSPSSYAPSESSMLRTPITTVRSARKRVKDKNSQPLPPLPSTSSQTAKAYYSTSTPRRSARQQPPTTDTLSNLSVGSIQQEMEELEKETSEEKERALSKQHQQEPGGGHTVTSRGRGNGRGVGGASSASRRKVLQSPLPASPLTPHHRYNLRARSRTPVSSPLH